MTTHRTDPERPDAAHDAAHDAVTDVTPSVPATGPAGGATTDPAALESYIAETSYEPGAPWSPPTLQGARVESVDAVEVATSFHAETQPRRPAAIVTENGPSLMTTVAAAVTSSHQEVTCPDCGRVSAISINRRESEDFCPACDYPLFWIVTNVVIDSTSAQSGSMRRLPGTAGRSQRAGVECPVCDELNAPTAVTCARCGNPMKPVAPVYEAPPPAPAPPPVEPFWPEPEPEPTRNLWWLWVIGGVFGAALVAWVTIGLLHALI